MLLFVGLGNPGAKHHGNRHNVGFLAVDAIARRHGFSPWRRRFHGETAEGSLGGVRVVSLKPHTFMNESGQAVQDAVRFFKLTEADVTAFHDELELPPMKLRVKVGGGIAGHNGLRSISAHLGNEYRRVRIGIGHPGVKDRVHGYVLSDYAKAEVPAVTTLCDLIAEHAALLAEGRDASFQNKVHLGMEAKGFGPNDDGLSGP